MHALSQSPSRPLRGLTLIEALLFLGIAALVIIGAIAFYNNASNQSNLNTAQTQVQSYIASVNTLYASQTDFDGLEASTLIRSGQAPDNAIEDEGGANEQLVNPWGGETTITEGGNPRQFEITMDTLQQDACIGLASSGMGSTSSIAEIQVNGTSVGGNPDPASVSAECADDGNAVTFVAQ